jgi:hypothetical protein
MTPAPSFPFDERGRPIPGLGLRETGDGRWRGPHNGAVDPRDLQDPAARARNVAIEQAPLCPLCRYFAWHENQWPEEGHHPACPALARRPSGKPFTFESPHLIEARRDHELLSATRAAFGAEAETSGSIRLGISRNSRWFLAAGAAACAFQTAMSKQREDRGAAIGWGAATIGLAAAAVLLPSPKEGS